MMIDDPARSWECEDFPSIVGESVESVQLKLHSRFAAPRQDEETVPRVVKSVVTLNKVCVVCCEGCYWY